MQDLYASTSHGASSYVGPSTSQPPLSSIAERRSDSGEDTDDDEGGWKTADVRASQPRSSIDDSVIKAGYLWKKGERRKVLFSSYFLVPIISSWTPSLTDR